MHSDCATEEPVPSTLKEIDIEAELVRAPPVTGCVLPSIALVIVVIGFIVSIVQVYVAAVASVLPARSVANT